MALAAYSVRHSLFEGLFVCDRGQSPVTSEEINFNPSLRFYLGLSGASIRYYVRIKLVLSTYFLLIEYVRLRNTIISKPKVQIQLSYPRTRRKVVSPDNDKSFAVAGMNTV